MAPIAFSHFLGSVPDGYVTALEEPTIYSVHTLSSMFYMECVWSNFIRLPQSGIILADIAKSTNHLRQHTFFFLKKKEL